MSNATASQCTLVNTALVIGGTLGGTFVVGMTLSGAGVPPGVTIVSQTTGPAGGAGSYVATASSANITAVEPFTGLLYGPLPFVSNARIPQLVDLGRAAGFGFIVGMCVQGPAATPGKVTQFGTHANAIYDAQAAQSTRAFKTSPGLQTPGRVRTTLSAQPQYVDPPQPQLSHAAVAPTEVTTIIQRTIVAAPQSYDFTLQAFIDAPTINSANAFSMQYTFGAHAKAVYDSQGGSAIWPVVQVPAGVVPGTQVPLRSIHVQPQLYDYTLQAWLTNIPRNQGWISTMVGAGPQAFDWTLQTSFDNGSPLVHPAAPINPKFFFAKAQDDPTQPPASVFKPPLTLPKYAPLKQISATPTPADATVNQGSVWFGSRVPPFKQYSPTQFVVPQQAYVDVPQGQLSAPLVGQLPIFQPITGQTFNFSIGTLTPLFSQLTGVYDYFSLIQAMLNFSHRTDIANYQDYYVQQGETRIYRDLFAENIGNGVLWLEQPYLQTLTNGTTPIPSNYLALKTAQVNYGSNTNTIATLLYTDPQWLYTNYIVRQQVGLPAYIARDGANFVYGPAPDSNYVITGTYYGSSLPLSAVNPVTWMCQYIPDILLAAVMLELQPFLKDPNSLKVWKSIYDYKLAALVNLDKTERLSPGTLAIEIG